MLTLFFAGVLLAAGWLAARHQYGWALFLFGSFVMGAVQGPAASVVALLLLVAGLVLLRRRAV